MKWKMLSEATRILGNIFQIPKIQLQLELEYVPLLDNYEKEIEGFLQQYFSKSFSDIELIPVFSSTLSQQFNYSSVIGQMKETDKTIEEKDIISVLIIKTKGEKVYCVITDEI
jgi:hypothetical protein